VGKMSRYKLIYFDYRGFAEPIRLALTHAGIQFEDVRHKYESGWQKKIKTPFRMLPILEIDGTSTAIPDSMVILRYVGRQHDLEADDPLDRALGDAMATTWTDVLDSFWAACDQTTMKWDMSKFGKAMEEQVKPRLEFIDEHLSKSKSGYLTGDKVTWSDFHVYTILSMLKQVYRAPVERFSHLIQFLTKMEDLPAIKSWRQDHPMDTWWGPFPGPYD